MKSIVLMIVSALIATSCAPRYYEPQQQQIRGYSPVNEVVGGNRVEIGQFIPNSCFGNQPTTPTAGCVRISYDQAFGSGIWANDFGHGKAQIQRTPPQELVIFDQANKWAWRESCHNRVKPIEIRQSQPVPQQVVYQQAVYQQPYQQPYQPRPLISIGIIPAGYRDNCYPPSWRSQYAPCPPPIQYQRRRGW